MDQKLIGQFIQQLRKEKGLTQAELAQKLGVSNKAVSKWETGKSMPDISALRPVSKALDVTVNELLSGERISNEPPSKQVDYSIVNMLGIVQKLEKERFIFLGLALLIIGTILLLISLVFESIRGDHDFILGFLTGVSIVTVLGGLGVVSFGVVRSLMEK